MLDLSKAFNTMNRNKLPPRPGRDPTTRKATTITAHLNDVKTQNMCRKQPRRGIHSHHAMRLPK